MTLSRSFPLSRRRLQINCCNRTKKRIVYSYAAKSGTQHQTYQTYQPFIRPLKGSKALLRVADELELFTGSHSDHPRRHSKWPLFSAARHGRLVAAVVIGHAPCVAAPAQGIVAHCGTDEARTPGVASSAIGGWKGQALQGKTFLEKARR